MTILLTEIYDVTLKKDLRDAAKEGFVRPTISQSFMTHKDFVEIPSAIPAIFDTTRKATDIALSSGNLIATNNASYDYGWVSVSIAPTLEINSKTYVEFEIIDRYADNIMLGLIFSEETFNYNSNNSYLNNSTNRSVVLSANGYNYFPNSGVVSGQYGVGDIIGITFDTSTKKVTFYNNNVFKYEATITGYTIGDCRYAAFLARYTGHHASVRFIKASEHNYTAPDGYKAFG